MYKLNNDGIFHQNACNNNTTRKKENIVFIDNGPQKKSNMATKINVLNKTKTTCE